MQTSARILKYMYICFGNRLKDSNSKFNLDFARVERRMFCQQSRCSGIAQTCVRESQLQNFDYRDQPWFSVFKHSMDHEEGV